MSGEVTFELEVAARLAALAAKLPPKGPVWIFTHDYPDPDALASAGALHLLLKRQFNRHSQIVFTGVAARAENRLMAKHFRFRWMPTERVSTGRRRLTSALYVDCQPWAGNIQMPAAARPVAVFDHHSAGRRIQKDGLFVDIRPELGATASMMWEYLHACEIAPPPWLATCLCYAILTETTEFTRSFTALDRQAYLALLSRADLKMLGQIRNAPLPQPYFAKVHESIAHTRLYGRIAWTHVENVPNPEVVPEIADRLIRLERITWSFCTGLTNGQMTVSLRSSRRDSRCDRVLKKAFAGEGSSGGHDRMAAGAMDISAIPIEQQREQVQEFTRRLLRRLDPRHALRDEDEALESRKLTPVVSPGAGEVAADEKADPEPASDKKME